MAATCGATCGITREREREKERVRALVRRAFPLGLSGGAAWEPDDAPFGLDEPEALARALAEVLPCRSYVVRSDGRGADWVYLVATVSPRSWLALREGLGDAPEPPVETAVRVGLSSWGRYATLQEVRLRGERDGDGWWVEEERLAGVEDRRLAAFVKATQGVLRARKVVALDAAFLCEPVEGGGDLWSVLFDPDPMGSRAGVWVATSA